jgi:hypothetical protein
MQEEGLLERMAEARWRRPRIHRTAPTDAFATFGRIRVACGLPPGGTTNFVEWIPDSGYPMKCGIWDKNTVHSIIMILCISIPFNQYCD